MIVFECRSHGESRRLIFIRTVWWPPVSCRLKLVLAPFATFTYSDLIPSGRRVQGDPHISILLEKLPSFQLQKGLPSFYPLESLRSTRLFLPPLTHPRCERREITACISRACDNPTCYTAHSPKVSQPVTSIAYRTSSATLAADLSRRACYTGLLIDSLSY